MSILRYSWNERRAQTRLFSLQLTIFSCGWIQETDLRGSRSSALSKPGLWNAIYFFQLQLWFKEIVSVPVYFRCLFTQLLNEKVKFSWSSGKNTNLGRLLFSYINPLVTIKVFSSFFYWKVKKKIHLGVKKANLKFCLDILVHHEDIRVKIFSDFFYSAHLFTVTDWQFLYSA